MSELLFGYLANSILRGAVVVGLLWLIELCCRRRLIFAGGRWLYLAALLLILLPFEQLAVLRASTPLPVRHVELPVWSVALPPPEPEEAAPAAEAPDVQTAPSGTASAVSAPPEKDGDQRVHLADAEHLDRQGGWRKCFFAGVSGFRKNAGIDRRTSASTPR